LDNYKVVEDDTEYFLCIIIIKKVFYMFLNISEEDKYNIEKVLNRFTIKKYWSEVFYDLCFAICAPQTKFTNNRKVIDTLISKDFYNKDIEYLELRKIVKQVRFLRKADYLLYAKTIFSNLKNIINSDLSEQEKRIKLIKEVKGLGWKASSHFLRNLGAKDLAIIDTHIIKFMKWEETPKDGKQYLLMEEEFRQIAKKNNLSIAALDAYIWKINSKTDWSEFIF
jgi:N-glycosylase/DNA lyase